MTETPLNIAVGEDWPLSNPDPTTMPLLRRIGWIDQKGRVYIELPPQGSFDGGSLHALLIDPRD